MSELGELLRAAMDHRLAGAHVSVPGKIVSYDATTQTCTVSPQSFTPFGAEEIRLPDLADVPVCFLRGGGFIFAFPLSAGDAVEIRFSDRMLDDWRGTGQALSPTDRRAHALADAFVVPAGVQPDANASVSAALAGGDLVILREGGAGLTVKANGDIVLGDVAGGAAALAVTSDPLLRAQLLLLIPAINALSSALTLTAAASAALSAIPANAAAAPATAAATVAATAASTAVSSLASWPATTATTKARAV